MSRPPNHRALRTEKGGKPETLEEELYAKRLAKEDVPREAGIAFDIYETPSKKEKVDALIIGGCPDSVFESVLKIPEQSIRLYKQLFLDTETFLTELDKLDFAEKYYSDGRSSVDNLVLRACNQGYQLLLLQFCNITPNTAEALGILKRIFAAAIYKATSVGFTGLGSGADKRAIELCKLALQILETIDDLNSDSAESENAMLKFRAILKESDRIPKDLFSSDII